MLAVVIRLRRQGKAKQPFYRIVASDSRSPRDGRFLEIVGYYNPMPEREEISIHFDRMLYWLRYGAKPSDTVRSLLKRNGDWQKLSEELTRKQTNSTTSEQSTTTEKEVEAQ